MENLTRLKELWRSRQLDEGWDLYQRYRTADDPEWHLVGSRIASDRYEWLPAKAAIDRALFLPAEGALEIRIHFQSGFVHRAVGDLYVAVREFDYCLEHLNAFPDLAPVLKGACFYNRALAYEYHRDKSLALAGYEQAAEEFRRESMPVYLRMTLQNAAWVLCGLGNVTRARELLEEAAPLCQDDSSLWHQRLGLAYLAQVDGDSAEALRLCDWILQSNGVEADVRSLCASVAAHVAVDLGQLELAQQMAGVAYAEADRAPSDSRCFSFVSKVYQRIQTTKARSGAGA